MKTGREKQKEGRKEEKGGEQRREARRGEDLYD